MHKTVETSDHRDVALRCDLSPLVYVADYHHVSGVADVLAAAKRAEIDEARIDAVAGLLPPRLFFLRPLCRVFARRSPEPHPFKVFPGLRVGDRPESDGAAARLDKSFPNLQQQRRRETARLKVYLYFAAGEQMAPRGKQRTKTLEHLTLAHIGGNDAF